MFNERLYKSGTSFKKIKYYNMHKSSLVLYSKVSDKRTVFNNSTGGDIILQKVQSQLGPWAFPIP